MDYLLNIWDIILHLDSYLESLIDSTGILVYIIMAFVVFAETAFVVTVFLPSDTILFAATALAAVNNSLSFPLLFIIFIISAALGDSVNFIIGRKLRHKIEKKDKVLFIKKENLQKADSYYQKNGTMTLIVARFIPVLRSFAPFIAGMSDRKYISFFKANIIGVIIWNIIFCSLGYFFGNLPFVQEYYSFIVVAIGCLSLFTALLSVIAKKIFSKSKSEQ